MSDDVTKSTSSVPPTDHIKMSATDDTTETDVPSSPDSYYWTLTWVYTDTGLREVIATNGGGDMKTAARRFIASVRGTPELDRDIEAEVIGKVITVAGLSPEQDLGVWDSETMAQMAEEANSFLPGQFNTDDKHTQVMLELSENHSHL